MDTTLPNTDASAGVNEESETSADVNEQETGGPAPNPPSSLEDIQEAKRAFQNLNASGNVANSQVFIRTLNMGSDRQYREDPHAPKEKGDVSFDLGISENCAKFVEEYRNGEYLALAITLAVFDIVTINDLPNIEDKLIRFLPDVDKLEDEDKAASDHRSNPYLSLNSKLAVIGAKSFIRNDGQNCVGFGSKSKQVLLNIWTQFPALRSPIISWLVEVSHIHKYHTSFDLQQIMGAFLRIISLDFSDAEKRIFPKLYSDPNNVFFLGTLACFLVKDPHIEDDVHNLLVNWAKSDSGWLWKSALFSYTRLDTPERYIYLKDLLQYKLRYQIRFYNKNDETSFLAKIFSCSDHSRQLLCETLNAHITANSIHKWEKEQTAQFYLRLVTKCYYHVDKLSPKLYFVACDTRAQQDLLSPVITQVLTVRPSRLWLFAVLTLYIKEISSYAIPDRLIKHITAYFINLKQSAPLYWNDVLAVLQECSCSVSERILELLHR